MGSSPAEMGTQDHDLPSSASGDEHSTGLSKKGTPWSVEEHYAFLKGLEKLGKGNWRGISRYYVPTRTPTQVASHAQKHFLRVGGNTKRRSRFAAIEEEVYGAQAVKAPTSTTPEGQQQQLGTSPVAPATAQPFPGAAQTTVALPGGGDQGGAPRSFPPQQLPAPSMPAVHPWMTHMQHSMMHMAAYAQAAAHSPPTQAGEANKPPSTGPVPMWMPPPGMAWAAPMPGQPHPHFMLYHMPHNGAAPSAAVPTPAAANPGAQTPAAAPPSADSPAPQQQQHTPESQPQPAQQAQQQQQPGHVVVDGIPCLAPHMVMPGYQQPAMFWHPAHGMMPHPAVPYHPPAFMLNQPGSAQPTGAPPAADSPPGAHGEQPQAGQSPASSTSTNTSAHGSGAASVANTGHMLHPSGDAYPGALAHQVSYNVPVKPEALLASWQQGVYPAPLFMDAVMAQVHLPAGAAAHLHHSQGSPFTSLVPVAMM